MTADRHPGDNPQRHHHLGNRHEDRPDPTPVHRLVGGVERLMSSVPYLLGFHPPAGSLAIVGLRHQLLAILLVRDIPTAAQLVTPDDVHAVWRHAGHVLDAHGCESVVLIAYAGPTRVEDLHHVVDAVPLPVDEAIRVHDGRWWSLDCPHPGCCTHPACTPAGKVIVEDLQVSSTMVALGHAVPGTRADLERILQPGPDDLLNDVAARLPLDPAPSREDLFGALTRAHDARTAQPAPLAPQEAATLLHGLADGTVRDACLAWEDDAAWWLWTDLIRTAPPGWIAPVSSVIAVQAYRRGDGVTASIAAEHALLDKPGFTLARLVLGLLDIATTPGEVGQLVDEAIAQLPPAFRPTRN